MNQNPVELHSPGCRGQSNSIKTDYSKNDNDNKWKQQCSNPNK